MLVCISPFPVGYAFSSIFVIKYFLPVDSKPAKHAILEDLASTEILPLGFASARDCRHGLVQPVGEVPSSLDWGYDRIQRVQHVAVRSRAARTAARPPSDPPPGSCRRAFQDLKRQEFLDGELHRRPDHDG